MNALILAISLFASSTNLPRTPAPKGAAVYIISPKNGETVRSPVLIQFGLKNMGIAPAGVNIPDTGHHHLIVDGTLSDDNVAIPATATHIHFGKGQTETTLELKPGTHTLQLVLGDYLHIPHKPPIKSEKITITVK